MLVLHDFRGLAKALRFDHLFRLKVAPVALSLPWGLSFAALPYLPLPARILVEVLPSVRFERHGEQAAEDEAYVRACATEVEGRMQCALTRLAQER